MVSQHHQELFDHILLQMKRSDKYDSNLYSEQSVHAVNDFQYEIDPGSHDK